MEFLQKIMMAKGGPGGGYVPVIKTLNTLGVEFKTVPAGQDVPSEWHGEDVIVIRSSELMEKEWKYMNDIETIQENTK
jgi:predicted transcriptional regulator